MASNPILAQPRTQHQIKKFNQKTTEIRNFIKKYMLEKGYSPSYAEIGRNCGFKSKSTIWYWLELMKSKELLDFDSGIPRSFRLPGQKIIFPE